MKPEASSTNVVFTFLGKLIWYIVNVPTAGPCCPTLGPHLDLIIMGPTVGQNKAPPWVHNNIFTFLSRHFLGVFCLQKTPMPN